MNSFSNHDPCCEDVQGGQEASVAIEGRTEALVTFNVLIAGAEAEVAPPRASLPQSGAAPRLDLGAMRPINEAA